MPFFTLFPSFSVSFNLSQLDDDPRSELQLVSSVRMSTMRLLARMVDVEMPGIFR